MMCATMKFETSKIYLLDGSPNPTYWEVGGNEALLPPPSLRNNFALTMAQHKMIVHISANFDTGLI